MARRAVLAHTGAALIALWSTTARAEPDRIALRWEAPEGCPPADRIKTEVDRLLGPHGARPPKPLEVVARVTKAPAGGFRVHLETPGDGGPREREIAGASCSAIADATAVILAFIIDPAAAAAAPEPSPPPPAPPPPSPPPTRPSPAPAASGIHPSFRLLAWIGADTGTLPSVAATAGGAAAVVLGPVRIEIGAGVWPARTAIPAPQLPSAGGTVSLVAGSLGACLDVLGITASRPFELGPCGGFELGRLHAAGFGVSSPSEASAVWAAPKLGGHFAWSPIRRLAFVARLDAAFPLRRPTFVLENVGPVHRPSAVVGRAAGGVELRF